MFKNCSAGAETIKLMELPAVGCTRHIDPQQSDEEADQLARSRPLD